MKVLKELGYDGVEWRVANPPQLEKPDSYSFDNRYWSYNLSTIDIKKVDKVAAEIKSICDKEDLDICSLTTYLGVWEVEDIERVIKAANTMNCKNIRVNVPVYERKRKL